MLEPLWDGLQANRFRVISSELTLLEALVLPLRISNEALVSAYERLLSNSEMRLIPIDRNILQQAAQIRARTNLKTPDAIHAATSFSSNCTLFLTNDIGFRKVSGLPIAILKEVLESSD